MNVDWFREALAEAARLAAQKEQLTGKKLESWQVLDILSDVLEHKP